MITACKRGHIDLIITKSLSRFARNTVDCLETVRLLKANGIGVYFEKENINTLTESSEFLITLFSGFAQAESESLSKNVAWGKAKSAEAGKVTFQYKKMLGYRKGADGQPEIVPEEAEVIKRIYFSSPPTMMDRVPLRAPESPPDTGASITRRPFFFPSS